MKKLVVLGLVAFAAVFAVQANQVKWSYSGKYTSANQPSDTPMNMDGFTAYLVLQSDWTDGSLATLQAKKIGSATITLTTSSNTKSVTTSTYGTGVQVSSTTLATAESANFYIVIADTAGEHFYSYSGSGSITTDGSNSGTAVTGVLNGANAITQNMFAANTFTDAPEPTSALLLLVGGAMLTLRRRKV